MAITTEQGGATVVFPLPGEPVTMTVEWAPKGVRALAVHLVDRTLDVGPRADPSFLGAS